MAYNDLREWITALERAGELRRIKVEVDPILEITEIADRVSKAGRFEQPSLKSYSEPGGPALLFETIKGQPGAKVLINQFGSAKRMKLALGVESLFKDGCLQSGLPWIRGRRSHDLENGIDLHLDAAQLAGALKRGLPLSQVVVGHLKCSPDRSDIIYRWRSPENFAGSELLPTLAPKLSSQKPLELLFKLRYAPKGPKIHV